MQTQSALKHFDLPPPDDETRALLDTIARTPSLMPAHERYVRFYSRSKQDSLESKSQGRPIFVPVEYIEILCPGDKDTVVDRPVRSLDKYLYQDKYRAFRDGRNQTTQGTTLEVWGGISPERILEYAPFRITTVEELADIPDSNLAALGFAARGEREKARDYLAVMKGAAPVAALRAENDQLKTRLEALERLAAQNTLEPQESPPPGVKVERRNPKSKEKE